MTSSAVTPQPSPPSEPSTREPSAAALRLREAIGSKQATVAIIGLGYVGLPLVRTALVTELPRSRSHDLPAMQSQPLTAEYLRQQDCVVITTAHQAYDYTFITNHAPLVVDTRNATAGITTGNVVKA